MFPMFPTGVGSDTVFPPGVVGDAVFPPGVVVSDVVFLPGVPFRLSTHIRVLWTPHDYLLLKIIKRVVISFLITSLLGFPPLASLALC